MKKFTIILFVIIFPFISLAHIGHYNKFNKIEMEIFRNGELIGYNYYFFKRNGEETTITNQLRFSVKLLGATIFQVESFGEEKYVGDQLISYKSKTLQNDKKNLQTLPIITKVKNLILMDPHIMVKLQIVVCLVIGGAIKSYRQTLK